MVVLAVPFGPLLLLHRPGQAAVVAAGVPVRASSTTCEPTPRCHKSSYHSRNSPAAASCRGPTTGMEDPKSRNHRAASPRRHHPPDSSRGLSETTTRGWFTGRNAATLTQPVRNAPAGAAGGHATMVSPSVTKTARSPSAPAFSPKCRKRHLGDKSFEKTTLTMRT
jgi:hypothetical protein